MAGSPNQQQLKRAILRQVYEDNLGDRCAGAARPHAPWRQATAPRRLHWLWPLALLAAPVLYILLPSAPAPATAPLLPQPRQAAIAPSDPVLQPPPPAAKPVPPVDTAALLARLSRRPGAAGDWRLLIRSATPPAAGWLAALQRPPSASLARLPQPAVELLRRYRPRPEAADAWQRLHLAGGALPPAPPYAAPVLSQSRPLTERVAIPAAAATAEVPIAELFGLTVRTIVIDPGHGGKDSGARGPSGLTEKDITLDVAQRLRDRLSLRSGYRVLLTRENDRPLTLRQRVAIANTYGADLFISIHVNALPVPWHAFVETYYFGPSRDATTVLLAEWENRESDYSMAEFREMIAKIGDTFKQQESRTLARSIQRGLYDNLQRHDRKIVDRGISPAPFAVLLGTEMPSILVEITSITNPQEEARLATAEYRDEIARYLEQGIVAYLERTDEKHIEGAKHHDGQDIDAGERRAVRRH
ncbi:MAG TPA: N-acetylmuramoyl-L-alanine amidase [Candidatus Competibacteraceae bacterium]|nr:N-acetylmuramoyl-L-alanine amidase [Candidatus Competibacteraceae bacterium]